MFLTLWLGVVALLLRSVYAVPANTTAYRDPDTGLTYGQVTQLYKTDRPGITFRIALPTSAARYSAYDAVVQIVVPSDVGWAGLAWNGGMQANPLLAIWKTTDSKVAIASSRWSPAHTTPTSYSGSTYTILKKGTKSNSTHWQITAKCTGCTSWTSGGAQKYLNPDGQNHLAFVYCATRPSNPNSESSSLMVHDVHGYWDHDFSVGENANFATQVLALES